MKTRWARAEIVGQRLYWLLTVTFAGRDIRIASEELDVSSDAGALHFYGGLIEVAFREAISLWDVGLQPTTGEVSALMPPDVDVPLLVAQGHRLGAATVELAQWYDGLAWEDRRVVLVGRVQDPIYGAAADPVDFGIVQDVYEDKGQIPDVNAEVNADTWNEVHLNAADLGLPYPLVFGYPGKTPRALSGWITGTQAIWGSKARFKHKLIIADGKVDASDVYINLDNDTDGQLVNLTTTTDDRGRTVTIVDYDAGDYDYNPPGPPGVPGANFLGADYCPDVAEDVEIFVGWYDGGGTIGADGTVLREAGGVIQHVLGYSSLKVDHAAFGSVKPRLAWFKVDGVIDAAVTPWEWLSSELLPLLPVSLVTGPDGVRPVVWDHNATISDALDEIDADADEAIEVGRIEAENSRLYNDFSLEYGYSARTEEYLYTARLGRSYVAPTGRARALLSSTGIAPRQVTVYAVDEGPDGQGIRVTLTDTGALNLAESATTRTVTLEYDGATSTLADIVTLVQTSTLIDCEDNDATDVWGTTGTPSVVLYLQDTGTRGSPVCAYSQDRYRTTEDDGVYTWTGASSCIYDDATADGVLGWMAAAFGLEVRTVQVLLPEDRWGWLGLGDVVAFTFADYALDRQPCVVTEVEWRDDRLIGVRLTIIENPARDLAPGGA